MLYIGLCVEQNTCRIMVVIFIAIQTQDQDLDNKLQRVVLQVSRNNKSAKFPAL